MSSALKTPDLFPKVLYQDQYLAVVNKPPGIVTSGNKFLTLERALPNVLEQSNDADVLDAPQVIHRLDFATSGALLVGKTKAVVAKLNKLFEERQIEKIYYAVTVGKIADQFEVSTQIDGKKAVSQCTRISSLPSDRYGFLNLVQVKLLTGRRNQIRIHLASIGNPILGDQKFGKGKVGHSAKLYLHARSLSFRHPITDERINVVSSLPKKFLKLFHDQII